VSSNFKTVRSIRPESVQHVTSRGYHVSCLLCFSQSSSTAALMDTPSTPVSADFSSSPPKRTKIVLLGDQSVGKTSLITRYASEPFQYPPSNYWHWLPEQDHVSGGPDCEATAICFCYPGTLPFTNTIIYPGLICCYRGFWHHECVLSAYFWHEWMPDTRIRSSVISVNVEVDRRCEVGAGERCHYSASGE